MKLNEALIRNNNKMRRYTHENIILNNLKMIPLLGVSARDASQNVLRIHALPSKPCLKKADIHYNISDQFNIITLTD